MADNPSEAENAPIENDSPESKNYNSFINYQADEKHFIKVGFWCAIHNAKNPLSAFETLLGEHKKFNSQRETRLKEYLAFDVRRFEEKIKDTAVKVLELKGKLLVQNDNSLIQAEIEKLAEKIEKLEKALKDAYKKLVEARKNLINNRIAEAIKDIKLLLESYDEILESYENISKRTYQNYKEAIDIKPNLYKRLLDFYEPIYQKLLERIKFYSISGASSFVVSRLVGTLSALAAGWFFSVFSLQTVNSNGVRGFGNNDVTFFLLSGLFGFGNKLKVANDLQTTVVQHSVFVFLVLGLIFLVTYGCLWLLNKTENKKTITQTLLYLLKMQEIEDSSDDETKKTENKKKIENSLSSKPVSSGLLSLWLHLFPLLLVLGITFVVLSIGEVYPIGGTTNLTELSNSLSSQASGVAIALGLAGLCFIYLTKVIEPRLDYKQNLNEEISWFNANIELALIVIGVIGSLVFLLFGVESTLFIITTKLLTFSMFILCCLISSFTLGYCTYFKGIVNSVKEVEEKIEGYSLQISRSSFPNLWSILNADKAMRTEFFNQIKNLQKLINQKTKIAEDFFSEAEKQSNQDTFTNKKRKKRISFGDRFMSILESRFLKVEKKEHFEEQRRNANYEEKKEENEFTLDGRFPTSQKDMECLPDFAGEVEDLKGLVKSEQAKLIELQLEVKEKQEERTYFIRKIKDETQTLTEQIYNWQKHISFLHREHNKDFDKLYKLNLKEIVDLQDGYNLGMWFRENKIAPTDEFYSSEVKNDGN